MRKLISILVVFTLFGCEKYELPSNPMLNLNGRWDVIKIRVVIDKVNYGSQVKVLNEDRASVSNFFVTGVTANNELLLSQEFEKILINRRFDIATTKWVFDYNKLRIIDDVSDEWMYVWFPCTYCTKRTVIECDYNGQKTRYTFNVDTYGAMPANELILSSQTFFTNIMVGGNQYDKAIESHLEITMQKQN